MSDAARLELASKFNNSIRGIISQLASQNTHHNNLLRVKTVFNSFAQTDEFTPIEHMGPLIMYFEDDILEERVQELLNFDYTLFIIDEAIPETRNFIIDLINICKKTWIQWTNNNDIINQTTFKVHVLDVYISAKSYGCSVMALKNPPIRH